MIKSINGATFRKMILAAANLLEENKKFVDALNVFPVPDGDTGTNMNLTIESGAKAVNENLSESVGDLTESLSKGMLMGARGNSGVITSQLFRGFYKATEGKDTLTAQDLANAFGVIATIFTTALNGFPPIITTGLYSVFILGILILIIKCLK